jgi:hypothetical protein
MTDESLVGHSAAPQPGHAVAVLGTGIMGSAMARNLVAAGLGTTVWDRSREATGRVRSQLAEEQPVGRLEAGPTQLAFEDGELVAEGQNLDLECGFGLPAEDKKVQQRADDGVEEAQDHGEDHGDWVGADVGALPVLRRSSPCCPRPKPLTRCCSGTRWWRRSPNVRCGRRWARSESRRPAEGKSKKEIFRCLKRYVAREVYTTLIDRPQQTSRSAT